MKCDHCSTPLEPREWFCSNCKRSQRPPARPARRPGVWIGRGFTAFLALSAGAAVAAQPWFRARVAAPARPLIAAAAPSAGSALRAMPAAGSGEVLPAAFSVSPVARP